MRDYAADSPWPWAEQPSGDHDTAFRPMSMHQGVLRLTSLFALNSIGAELSR